jgi:hypothetical protein
MWIMWSLIGLFVVAAIMMAGAGWYLNRPGR